MSGEWKTRAGKAGKKLADAILEMVHLMYQKNTARNFLRGLIRRLSSRLREFDK